MPKSSAETYKKTKGNVSYVSLTKKKNNISQAAKLTILQCTKPET